MRKILPFVFTALMISGSVLMLDVLGSKNREESLQLTEQAVRRYAVQCYAVEGFYPQSLSYLEDKYSLYLDRENYIIDYRFTGSNIMPDITVFEKEA